MKGSVERMDTFEKETDMLIKKSVSHKKDLIPDSYRTRLLNTLDSLPEKTGSEPKNDDSDVEIIEKRHKIEFKAVISAAAAVVFLFGGYSVFSKIVKPGNKPEVTDASAVIKTEETTETSVTEPKISALYDDTETTGTEAATDETLTETDSSAEKTENVQVIVTQLPDPDKHKDDVKVPDEDQKIHQAEPVDPKAGPNDPKPDDKGLKSNDKGPKSEPDDPKSDNKRPKDADKGAKVNHDAPKDDVKVPKP